MKTSALRAILCSTATVTSLGPNGCFLEVGFRFVREPAVSETVSASLRICTALQPIASSASNEHQKRDLKHISFSIGEGGSGLHLQDFLPELGSSSKGSGGQGRRRTEGGKEEQQQRPMWTQPSQTKKKQLPQEYCLGSCSSSMLSMKC